VKTALSTASENSDSERSERPNLIKHVTKITCQGLEPVVLLLGALLALCV
jgi:uncharacterized protein VirK/YbjX